MTATRELAYDDLAAWLDNLAGALGERLLRLKGLLRVTERSPPRAERRRAVRAAASLRWDGGEPFLVVIVRDAEPADLDATPPRGLFRVSRWSEPSVFSRDPPPRLPKAEAV